MSNLVPMLVLVMAAGFALVVTLLALSSQPLYWGRIGSEAVPMSSFSRGAFAATVWLMIATVVSGVSGWVAVKPVLACTLVAFVLTAAGAWLDRRRWRRTSCPRSTEQ